MHTIIDRREKLFLAQATIGDGGAECTDKMQKGKGEGERKYAKSTVSILMQTRDTI